MKLRKRVTVRIPSHLSLLAGKLQRTITTFRYKGRNEVKPTKARTESKAKSKTNKTSKRKPPANTGHTEEYIEATVFDQLNRDCLYEILDWLPLDSLCSFSQTCKSSRQSAKEYFRWKYPSQEISVGDEFVFHPQRLECFGEDVQELCLYDSTIADFELAGQLINENVRQIEFDRTFEQDNQITREHVDSLRRILPNVKTIRAVTCEFNRGCLEYLLSKCMTVEDIAVTIGKDHAKSRFLFKKYPTLRNIHLQFHPKADVLQVLAGMKEEELELNQLILLIAKEHSHLMKVIFKELDAMHQMGMFKQLFLAFERKADISEHLSSLMAIQYLDGVTCTYTIQSNVDNHIAELAMLQNIRHLNINWLLIESQDADHIAQRLHQLEQLEITVVAMDVIGSFVRFSPKLTKFEIDQVRSSNPSESVTKLNAFLLNKERAKLQGARKLNIYILEEKFIKIKWSMTPVTSDLVDIKRQESYIPKGRISTQ